MQPIATIVGVLSNGISNVCFSKDGTMMAALAMDQDHTLALFSVTKLIEQGSLVSGNSSALLLCSRGPSDDIFDIRFSSNDPGTIVAGSKRSVYFITANAKRGSWTKKTGKSSKGSGNQAAICIAFAGG